MAHNSAQVSGLKKPFCFEFVDEGRSCKFQANVNIPGDISKVDEFGKRIVNYHGLPVYLEEGNFLKRGQSICEHSLIGAVYMEARFGWLTLSKTKFLHINTHKQTGPNAGMKFQRYRHILFSLIVKTTKLF